MCAYLPLPTVDCSRLAPGLCLWEGAVACEAHPGHPPHSHRPGPGKEWMGYLTDEPASDFWPVATAQKEKEGEWREVRV